MSNLPKLKNKSKKRVGRGLGSGLGKTGGRGTKGQKARDSIQTNLAQYKKLPLRLGYGNPKRSAKLVVLNLSTLDKLPAKEIVTWEKLVEYKLINAKEKRGVKILSSGQINKSLTIKVPISAKARQKIEQAGGKVESV